MNKNQRKTIVRLVIVVLLVVAIGGMLLAVQRSQQQADIANEAFSALETRRALD